MALIDGMRFLDAKMVVHGGKVAQLAVHEEKVPRYIVVHIGKR
jgi:hypothetical protein